MNMDLITLKWEEKVKKEGPLAQRMRPRSLDEFVGQEAILGKGKPLRHLIEEDRLHSAVFHGPPGTGKTTLAYLIAAISSANFVQLNAVESGVKELREIVEGARERWSLRDRRTILFIDEIHRFNKAQQDALLSAVELGTVVFIGATTENPFFSLTAPLLSRTRLFLFEPLPEEAIALLLQRALSDRDRGLGGLDVAAAPGVINFLAAQAAGDARVALNALEMSVKAALTDKGTVELSLPLVSEVFSRRLLLYDRSGDAHYDIVSALIKSIRGSDPDAALYWLARMIEGGEDPMFIARRLMISAAEDIGNADPQALLIAVAAAQAVKMIGMPEGKIPLAQAVTYLAAAPKSNASYTAIAEALKEVRQSSRERVPGHLRDSSYSGAARLGHGKGYLYPHDYPGNYVIQNYLPQGLDKKRFYHPADQGYEKIIKKRLERLRQGSHCETGDIQ